jgi:hypothetical protein
VSSTSNRIRPFSLAFLALLVVPAALLAVGQILDLHRALPDYDSRVGQAVAPSTQALSLVASLGAHATWNAFGTPQSLIKYGDYLATGLPADAVTAARAWIQANKALFRLSDAGVSSLELVNDSPITGTQGHAVLFRQTFGGLPAAQDGMITVGVIEGKIAYVSSSAAGDQAAPGAPTIDATTAWLDAATSIGRTVSLAAISATRLDNSWTLFDVSGFAQPQRARLVGFPTPANGVRPAYETIVLDAHGGSATAYTLFVDAQTGQVLFRQNRVYQLSDASAPSAQPFTGSYRDAPDPPGPGPCHVFTVAADTATIDVTVTADVVSNDIAINLYSTGTCTGSVVGSSDVATSPEAIHYARPLTDPLTYSVNVFPSPAPATPDTAPYSYTGALLSTNVSPQTIPFPPKWKWFTAYPLLDYSSTDTRKIGCWDTTGTDLNKSVSDCQLTLDNLASRVPWDLIVQTDTPSATTFGNNAKAAEAWTSPLTPAEGYMPASPTRDYIFPWTNQWATSTNPAASGRQGCSPTVFTSAARNDIDASIANLFSVHNRMHDFAYFLGFTERNFNLQVDNFGLTAPGPYPLGRQDDPELGDAQAGGVDGGYPSFEGRDNANQITLNDGIPGITNQYLFQPLGGSFYAPCVDGGLDMSVVGHEYTHAISNRMVGGPDASLTGAQAGAMGESWSDLDAVEYLNEFGFAPIGGENPFAVGAYVTGNKTIGIRNYSLDNNPLNYSDVGYDVTGPEVHADGEIWNATNFEIRSLLISKYNSAFPATSATLQATCANGKLPAGLCPGNRRWIQIVYDAFLLMPANSSMLDARDAYLAADVMRFSGANQTELWRAFARRGMGKNASSAGTDDPDPVPDFESPREGAVQFQFQVLDASTNLPIKARIFVGNYEADAVPIADTDSATPLSDKAKFVSSSTFDFLVQANGYGAVSFPHVVSASLLPPHSQPVVLTVKMPKNWASSANGASASGDGANLANLIDDTESTQWTAHRTPDVNGAQVTVQLGGGKHTINRVAVSGLEKGQGRFTALRQFQVAACVAAASNANCTAPPLGFTTILTSAANAFPGDVPRPLAPEMLLRGFSVPATSATHVQIKVLTNQCTGQPRFQGEQSADPSFSTDCRIGDGGTVLPPKNVDVTAAEFQVFSSAPTVPK